MYGTETHTPLDSPTGLLGTHKGYIRGKDSICPIDMKGTTTGLVNGTNYVNDIELGLKQ
jgi:hypothetical protein